jgi:hypothetical protein
MANAGGGFEATRMIVGEEKANVAAKAVDTSAFFSDFCDGGCVFEDEEVDGLTL